MKWKFKNYTFDKYKKQTKWMMSFGLLNYDYFTVIVLPSAEIWPSVSDTA